MGRKITEMSTAEAINLMYPDATEEQKTLMTMGAEACEEAQRLEDEAELERETTENMTPEKKLSVKQAAQTPKPAEAALTPGAKPKSRKLDGMEEAHARSVKERHLFPWHFDKKGKRLKDVDWPDNEKIGKLTK